MLSGTPRAFQNRVSTTKPFYRRWWFWTPLSIILVLFIVSLLIDPIATHFARKGLDQIDAFESDFDGVHVSLLKLSVSIEKLKMTERPVTEGKKPLFYAEHIGASVIWKELIKFHLAANAQVSKMKVTFYMSPPEIEKVKKVAKEVVEKAPPWDDIPQLLQQIFPFKVVRVEVRDSELLAIDKLKNSNAEIWINQIELSIENFANRKHLEGGRPLSIAMRAKLMRSGTLSLFATADPLLKVPAFAGQAEVKGFNLHDIEPFFTAFTDLKLVKGEFDCFVAFKSEDDKIVGGVKPILKNLDIESPDKDIGRKLEAALADTAFKLVSDRVPGRDALATEIPIRGKIQNPDIQVLPAIFGVVRNAFVIGLSESFANVPPKPANENQGFFKQAADALSKDKVSPKAQPKGGT